MALDVSKLKLASSNVLVLDAAAGHPIYAKAADTVTPIASVTKLMTAMVVLDAAQPLDENVPIEIADLDLLRGSHSRLRLGIELPRREMLRLALMASENRAASTLARHYPGGFDACIAAMNKKAQRPRHGAYAFQRRDRTDQRERIDRQRSRADGQGRRGVSDDP